MKSGICFSSAPVSALFALKRAVQASVNPLRITAIYGANRWQLDGTSAVVPILIGEGFFYYNLTGTNQSRAVSPEDWP